MRTLYNGHYVTLNMSRGRSNQGHIPFQFHAAKRVNLHTPPRGNLEFLTGGVLIPGLLTISREFENGD